MSSQIPLWNASSFIGLESYDDKNLIISKHVGSKYLAGKTYYATPISGGGLDLSVVISGLLKSLPEDSILQVLLMSFPDRDAQYDYLRGKNTSTNPLIQNLVLAQSRVFERALQTGWQDDTPGLNKKRLAISLALPIKAVEEEALAEQHRIQNAFLVNLKSCGFTDASSLSANELVGLYRGMVKLEQPKPVTLDALEDLSVQAFDPSVDFKFNRRHTGQVGDRHIGCVTVKYYPESVSAGLMNLVSGAPMNDGTPLEGGGIRVLCPWMMCTTIRVAKQSKERERLDRAISSRQNTDKLPINFKLEDSAVVLNDLVLLQKQCANDQDVYVNASTCGVVFGKTEEEALEHTAVLETVLNKLQFECYKVAHTHGLYFSQLLPLNYSIQLAKNLGNEVVMAGRAAARLLPVYSDFEGNARHTALTGTMFVTRRGEAHAFDPYNSDNGCNGVIAATTGAGKSFLTQAMITNALADGTRVFLFDNGRSSKKLADALGGDAEFQDFDPDTAGGHVSCNPFTRLDGKQFEEQADTITELLLKMAYFEEEMDKGSRIAMREAVGAAWAKDQSKAEIETVMEALKSVADSGADIKSERKPEVIEAAMNLAPRLRSFIDSPNRGRFFMGPNTLSIRAQFTVYELSGLGGDKHLKQCVLFFVMNNLLEQVRTTPGRKLIMVDEAWELVLDEGASMVMDHLYRKVRKDSGSVWIITQSLLDLANTTTGAVILAQSQWKLVLKQVSEEIERLIDQKYMPDLTKDPYFCRLLGSVRSVKRSHSEVLITGGGWYEVVRLYVDPFAVALFSTDADRDQVFKLMKDGMGAVDAILQVTTDEEMRRKSWLQEIAHMLTAGLYQLPKRRALSEVRAALGLT